MTCGDGDVADPKGSKLVLYLIRYTSICFSGLKSGILGHIPTDTLFGICLVLLSFKEQNCQALPPTYPTLGLANCERQFPAIMALHHSD